MTSTTIEKLREKAVVAYDRLAAALDEEDHGPWCVLRCVEDTNPDADHTHECPICGEDEGTNG